MGPADLLIVPLQRALDALVAARARTRAQAAALDGRTVAVELTELGLTLAFCGDGERLVVRRLDEAPAPDATLRGTSAAFVGALVKQARGADPSVLAPGLAVTGDALLVRDLAALLADLEFDWEERLATLVGDAAAHRLGNLARAFGGWSRYAGGRLGQGLAEYLREETRDLVAKDEVARFNDGVDAVRSDVERAAARLELIEQALVARHGGGTDAGGGTDRGGAGHGSPQR